MNFPKHSFIDKFSIGLSKVTKYLTAVIVIIMAYEVFLRYVFNDPTLWVTEMSLWLGGMIYLFSGVYTMQKRAHIRIDILYQIVPKKVKRVFNLISLFCILAFTVALVVGAWNSSLSALMRWETFGTAWNPPIPATMKPLLLIVASIIAIQAINNFVIDEFRQDDDPDSEPKKMQASTEPGEEKC